MKVLIAIILIIAAALFVMAGASALSVSKGALHDIFGFMCIGFAGLFFGQIGIMIAVGKDE